MRQKSNQAIIWTNAGILLTGPLGTNFNEILIGIQTFSLQKMHLKVSSAKWRPFCLGLNVLIMPVTSSPVRWAFTDPHENSQSCNIIQHGNRLCVCAIPLPGPYPAQVIISITMTSQWAWLRLKSPASPLFTQPFTRAQIKENIKVPRHWPLCGEFTGDR